MEAAAMAAYLKDVKNNGDLTSKVKNVNLFSSKLKKNKVLCPIKLPK